MILSTRRLCLRCWADTDRLVFAALNAHQEVMHDYRPISHAESDAKLDG
jgi:hypothetical protein